MRAFFIPFLFLFPLFSAIRFLPVMYSPYAKVLVKIKTTPKNTTFGLLYLNHHNIPTIENLGANT